MPKELFYIFIQSAPAEIQKQRSRIKIFVLCSCSLIDHIMAENKADKPQNVHFFFFFYFHLSFAAKYKPQFLMLPQALEKDSG